MRYTLHSFEHGRVDNYMLGFQCESSMPYASVDQRVCSSLQWSRREVSYGLSKNGPEATSHQVSTSRIILRILSLDWQASPRPVSHAALLRGDVLHELWLSHLSGFRSYAKWTKWYEGATVLVLGSRSRLSGKALCALRWSWSSGVQLAMRSRGSHVSQQVLAPPSPLGA